MSNHFEPDDDIPIRPDATKRDLMIAVWEALDCESVGGVELQEIQQVLEQRFGKGGQASPAEIARVLADEGAALRHPEIVECDVRWRRTLLGNGLGQDLKFETIEEAIESFDRLREMRQSRLNEAEKRQPLQDLVNRNRAECVLRSKSPILSESQRAEAKEIVSWFDIWIRTPDLFADWLDLRRGSAQFKKSFGSK